MDVIFVPFRSDPFHSLLWHGASAAFLSLEREMQCVAHIRFHLISWSSNVEMKTEWKFNVKNFVAQTIYYVRLNKKWLEKYNTFCMAKTDKRTSISFLFVHCALYSVGLVSRSYSCIHECGLKILSRYALVFLANGWTRTGENTQHHTLCVESHVDALEIVWLVFKAKNDLWWPFTIIWCPHLFFDCSFVLLLFFFHSFGWTELLECQTTMHRRTRSTWIEHTCHGQRKSSHVMKVHATCNIIISQIYVLENNKRIKNTEQTKGNTKTHAHICAYSKYVRVCFVFITSFWCARLRFFRFSMPRAT